MEIWKIVNAILGLLAICSCGYFLARSEKMPRECQDYIPKLITNISLPCLLLTAFLQLDRSEFPRLLHDALLPYCSMSLCLLAAFAMGKLCRVNRSRFGLFCACIANPNCMYIGLPFTLAVFGEAALPAVLTYYFANTTFFWTVGNFLVSSDATASAQRKPNLRQMAKRLLAPPMLGLFAGIVVWLCNIKLPGFILDSTRSLGRLAVPLALLFVGISLNRANLRNQVLDRDLCLVMLGRLILSPCLMVLLLPFFNVSTFTGDVFLIQAALPVLMQAAILSAYYQTDSIFGSAAVALSALCSAFTIPLVLLIFGRIHF